MTTQDHAETMVTRRIAWVRASRTPPGPTGASILERQGILAPMEPIAPPFLLLGEDRFVRGAFPMHHHEGIETVTYLVEGAVEHEDSLGNRSIVDSGGVQWMTAGRGIHHSEEPTTEAPVHGFQLWIALPPAHKQVAPQVQTAGRDAQAHLKLPGGSVRIAAGWINGIRGPIETLHPATMAILDLETDGELHLDLDPRQAVLLHVRTGHALVLDEAVPSDHGAYLHPGSGALVVRAQEACQILLYAAVPSMS